MPAVTARDCLIVSVSARMHRPVELARGGTASLDEVGDISPELQIKLRTERYHDRSNERKEHGL